MTPVFTADIRLLSEFDQQLGTLETFLLAQMREAIIDVSKQPQAKDERVVFYCSRYDEEWDMYLESSDTDVSACVEDMMDMFTGLFDYALLPDIQLEAVNGVIVLEERC